MLVEKHFKMYTAKNNSFASTVNSNFCMLSFFHRNAFSYIVRK